MQGFEFFESFQLYEEANIFPKLWFPDRGIPRDICRRAGRIRLGQGKSVTDDLTTRAG